LNNSLYTGVKLVGEIHANVFGGITNTDGYYTIPNFTIINGPFSMSANDELLGDLSTYGNMFMNLDPTSLINVLSGIYFTNSLIPNNIFSGCSNLLSVSGFFSNETIRNNGQVYEFPS